MTDLIYKTLHLTCQLTLHFEGYLKVSGSSTLPLCFHLGTTETHIEENGSNQGQQLIFYLKNTASYISHNATYYILQPWK